MIISETKLLGAYVIEIEKIEDERGFFARTGDNKIFEGIGIKSKILQSSISFNKEKGTLRGMHYQIKPFAESKKVRCTKGKIYDVIVDLRSESQTYKEWFSIELSESNHKILYVPEGFAHGFQTLEDNSEVNYEINQIFNLDYARGFRWNDSIFDIQWPLQISNISQKDKNYKSYADAKI